MSHYNIPESVEELFSAGEAEYSITDPEQAMDNTCAMRMFLEILDVPEKFIESNDGTQVTLCDGTTRLVIDCGGLGDFHLHGYSVSAPEAM